MDGAKPVQVVFTPEEYASILRHADRLGVPVAEYVRRAVAVLAEEPPGPCPAADARRGASVPPVERGLAAGGTPALRRFLDTLAASAEPKE
ncbi:CopG family transcriptional regulator OS=Streptomyces alboniger OX=132473 GN=CP975_01570 PE=4 SV=1 [Streptomyces alboniger]